MPDLLWYFTGGFTAGILGGYLGLGGGEILVPFLTVVAGVDIKAAVPVSVAAVVVNSFSSSYEYMKRGMVDVELVVLMGVSLVAGNIVGSRASVVVSAAELKVLLTALLIYTSVTLLRGRKSSRKMVFADNRAKYMRLCLALVFFVGVIAALVGIGGGIFLVPILYLIIGLPLNTARGTTAVMICFASASATAVYLQYDMINLSIVSPVLVGIAVGGKLGGFFGTLAKPIIIRILFFVVMLYLAFKLIQEPLAWLI